ncbi:unnamed protein product [Tenebrio molitor]|nr:unnamed protein product [Tenebrio molitor]
MIPWCSSAPFTHHCQNLFLLFFLRMFCSSHEWSLCAHLPQTSFLFQNLHFVIFSLFFSSEGFLRPMNRFLVSVCTVYSSLPKYLLFLFLSFPLWPVYNIHSLAISFLFQNFYFLLFLPRFSIFSFPQMASLCLCTPLSPFIHHRKVFYL